MAKTQAVVKTDSNDKNQLSRASFTTELGESNIQSNADIKVLIEKAKFIPLDQLEELTGSYAQLEDGETYIFFCKGIAKDAMKSLKDGEDFNDAVELINEEGNDVINADIVLLSTVRKLEANGKLPCFIRIYVDGKKGAKGAEYKNLVIHKVS